MFGVLIPIKERGEKMALSKKKVYLSLSGGKVIFSASIIQPPPIAL
jgi:hypothetical protein